MVEVVGKDVSVAKSCVCKGCSSVLRYYPNDVSTGTYRHGAFTTLAYFRYIKCPSCSNNVIVEGF